MILVVLNTFLLRNAISFILSFFYHIDTFKIFSKHAKGTIENKIDLKEKKNNIQLHP